jgi:hypothetical protein
MPLIPKKTCERIITSGNDYLGALKGNHSKFFKALKLQFKPETHVHTVETGHGRVERRTVALCNEITLLYYGHSSRLDMARQRRTSKIMSMGTAMKFKGMPFRLFKFSVVQLKQSIGVVKVLLIMGDYQNCFTLLFES